MKYNKMMSLCIIEFRFSSPNNILPFISVHQHSYQNEEVTTIDLLPLKYNDTWSIEKTAKEIILFISSTISLQSFGIDIFNN
jgi:hypothetical protein